MASSLLIRLLCFLLVEVLILFAVTVLILAPIYPLYLLIELAGRLMQR